MEAIQNTQQASQNQTVTPKSSTDGASSGDEFEVTLRKYTTPDAANKVSEEDLFAGLVQERLQSIKGDGALASFQEKFTAQKDKMRAADGYIPMEDAAKAALKELRSDGTLSTEEADTIYSQAFAGAQLDDNKDALYDGRGGMNDQTVALATMEQALLGSRVLVQKVDAGNEEVKIRSLDEASNTKTAAAVSGSGDTSDDFLFKPVSESDGNLVVLLPSSLTGLISSASLIGPDGTLIESGRYSGVGNGDRTHFRFSKPGSSYPANLTVQAKLDNGETVSFNVANPSERTGGTSGSSTISTTNSSSTSEGSNSGAPATSNANPGSSSSSSSPNSENQPL